MGKERKIDLVILGLLSHEDLTGYDIKKHLDGAIGFFWKGSFGNIYPALTALEKEGFVKISASKEDGRIKIVSLTEQGQKYNQTTKEISKELLERFYLGFSEEEKNQFLNLLIKISGNFSED